MRFPTRRVQSTLPMGIEFIEKDVVQLTERFRGKETPIHEASLMIIVEAEGGDRVSNEIGNICLTHGAVDVFIAGGERAADLLTFREKAWPAIVDGGHADMADVVVPRSRVAEFVQRALRPAGSLASLLSWLATRGMAMFMWPRSSLRMLTPALRQVGFFSSGVRVGVSMGDDIGRARHRLHQEALH